MIRIRATTPTEMATATPATSPSERFAPALTVGHGSDVHTLICAREGLVGVLERRGKKASESARARERARGTGGR